MATLTNREGVRFELKPGTTTVGRGATNDIVIQHNSVSRQHAEVRKENANFYLRDLNSANGTWVSSHRVGTVQLSSGDVVRFGDVELSFDDAKQSRQQRGPTRRRRWIVGLIAVVLLLTVGGIALWRRTSETAPTTPSWSSSPIANNPTEGPRAPVAGVPENEVGRAMLDALASGPTASRSLASVDAMAQMCNQGATPAQSIPCRIAYIERHAEGKDLDRGTDAVIPYSEVAIFCVEGILDRNSPICQRAYVAAGVPKSPAAGP